MPPLTRILLIDGDAASRKAIGASLTAAALAHELVEAEDAETGFAQVVAQEFDCVLLDCRPGGVGDRDVLARLIAPQSGRQSVVALTHEADEASATTWLRAGATDSLDLRATDPASLARAIRFAQSRRAFIVDLQAARADAEEKTDEMERLNRQKTLILSIIAHDLRNPFQVMLGMSQLLLETAAASDTAAIVRRAGIVLEAATQAHGLMESLVGWAGLYMDARVAQLAPIDIDALFASCSRDMQLRADAKGVALASRPSGAQAMSQPDAAAAILRNLVGNALKFTASGGLVTLSAARRGDHIVIDVADTGVGMSEAQSASLFHLERRSTSAGTDGERGAGLGLLLCRDLAEWIGATIEVESRLGEGATFRLVMPAAVEAT